MSWQLEELEQAANLVQKEEQSNAQENTPCLTCDPHEFEDDDDSSETTDDDDSSETTDDDDKDGVENDHGRKGNNEEDITVIGLKTNSVEFSSALSSGSEKDSNL